MKAKHPKTRIEASAPNAVQHLSQDSQEALEMSGEVEHHDGPNRERIVKASKRLGEKGTR
jgi:hypothetical protein